MSSEFIQAEVEQLNTLLAGESIGNVNKAGDFVAWLQERLVPDLRESGTDGTADDFETCITIISLLLSKQPVKKSIGKGMQYEELEELSGEVGATVKVTAVALIDLINVAQESAEYLKGYPHSQAKGRSLARRVSETLDNTEL